MEYSSLLTSIKTVDDRNKLYSEINLVSEAIYKEGELEKVLENQISKTLAEYMGNERSVERLLQNISDLKKDLDQLMVVKLTLAYEPSESTIVKIITFIRKNLGEKTIIEVRFEPKILGGAIFEFKGLYKDYTLKSKLEEVFKTKREELFKLENQNEKKS